MSGERNGSRSDDERFKSYEPDALPRSITRSIYISYGIGRFNNGRINLDDVEPTESEDDTFAKIVILKKDITFELPACKVDIKERLLEIYNDEKRRVIAENRMRLKVVEDKISNLLSIEHHQTEEA